MFGLDSISWRSFLIFALVLCVVLDAVVVLVIKLRRPKTNHSDAIRMKKSMTYSDDEDITVKSAYSDFNEQEMVRVDIVEETVKNTPEEQTASVDQTETNETEANGEAMQYDQNTYEGMFGEETLPTNFIPQKQKEAIVSNNNMLTYDEMMKVLEEKPETFEVKKDPTATINNIFTKYAPEEGEKGEEKLDESTEERSEDENDDENESEGESGKQADDNYDDDPSKGFMINANQRCDDNTFGTNPYI